MYAEVVTRVRIALIGVRSRVKLGLLEFLVIHLHTILIGLGAQLADARVDCVDALDAEALSGAEDSLLIGLVCQHVQHQGDPLRPLCIHIHIHTQQHTCLNTFKMYSKHIILLFCFLFNKKRKT